MNKQETLKDEERVDTFGRRHSSNEMNAYNQPLWPQARGIWGPDKVQNVLSSED